MRRGTVANYYHFAVGQRVLVHELTPGPGEAVLRSATAISLQRIGTVSELWVGETGAQMTVHLDDGNTTRMCVNPYGQQHGGFGHVDVLRKAPTQTTLPGVKA